MRSKLYLTALVAMIAASPAVAEDIGSLSSIESKTEMQNAKNELLKKKLAGIKLQREIDLENGEYSAMPEQPIDMNVPHFDPVTGQIIDPDVPVVEEAKKALDISLVGIRLKGGELIAVVLYKGMRIPVGKGDFLDADVKVKEISSSRIAVDYDGSTQLIGMLDASLDGSNGSGNSEDLTTDSGELSLSPPE